MTPDQDKLIAIAEATQKFWYRRGAWTVAHIETNIKLFRRQEWAESRIRGMKQEKRLYDNMRQALLDAGYEAPTADEMGEI